MAVLAVSLTVRDEPQQLPDGKLAHKEVILSTPGTNSADVMLAGDESVLNEGQGFPIPPGSVIKLKLSRLESVYFSGTTGDKLNLIAELE